MNVSQVEGTQSMSTEGLIWDNFGSPIALHLHLHRDSTVIIIMLDWNLRWKSIKLWTKMATTGNSAQQGKREKKKRINLL